MKVSIIFRESNELCDFFDYAERVATRPHPLNPEYETQVVVYVNNFGHAFSARFYDVVIDDV